MTYTKIKEGLIFDSYRKIMTRLFVLPSGKRKTFEIDYVPTGGAIVVATDTDGSLILVRQFRPGPEKEFLEFVAGAIDVGETPAEAGARELLEETGYQAGELISIGSYWKGAYDNEQNHIFFAKGCEYVGGSNPDENEFIQVVIMSTAEFRAQMMDNNVLSQNHFALFMALEKGFI